MSEVEWHLSHKHILTKFPSIWKKKALLLYWSPLCIIIHFEVFTRYLFILCFSTFFRKKGILIFSPFFIFNFAERGRLIKCLYLSGRMSVSSMAPLDPFSEKKMVDNDFSFASATKISFRFFFLNFDSMKIKIIKHRENLFLKAVPSTT